MKQVRTQGSLKVARRRFYNDLCWMRLEHFLRTPDRIADRIDCNGFCRCVALKLAGWLR
jgi:hypothetical protein